MIYPSLFSRIRDISERASIESGTSYEEYLRLFTLYFEQQFKSKSVRAVSIAREFGYEKKRD
ncbi:hypothetical protein VH1709_contig00012-0010 [Vibrio harveyi]|nr:hypothetical protein VH1709_contig00012-0010 [Vibrio harveyi]